jgi:2-haloacid dehalogenase
MSKRQKRPVKIRTKSDEKTSTMTTKLGFDPERIQALTFDCYGTLIDWLGGMRSAIAATPSLDGCDLDLLLMDREQDELDTEIGPYRLYREVLAISLARAARRQRLEPTEEELSKFADSVGDWPMFAETHEALIRLKERYRLAILSNIDTDILKRTVATFDVPIDELVTAEQLRSYKPAYAHFNEALTRLDLPKAQVLHVAQSVRHDIAPATKLGWNVAWVNRLGERLPDGIRPNVVTSNLNELVTLLGC